MSSFTNPAAQELAREILAGEDKESLRAQVFEAVAELRTLVADTKCGSTLTFMKTGEEGNHYFYACVKNGTKWYTTAQSPRILNTDSELIEWLIGLEIFKTAQIEHQASPHNALAPGAPIEATAIES